MFLIFLIFFFMSSLSSFSFFLVEEEDKWLEQVIQFPINNFFDHFACLFYILEGE